jgi:hypothetical protein
LTTSYVQVESLNVTLIWSQISSKSYSHLILCHLKFNYISFKQNNNFVFWGDTISTDKYTQVGCNMLPIPKFILCLIKGTKAHEIHCFFLKTRSHFSSLIYFFFSQINTKKKLHVNVPEMFSFNPKTSIQKHSIFCSWYNIFQC